MRIGPAARPSSRGPPDARANGSVALFSAKRRGARHRARHVGDAVVDHVVDDVRRVGMRRRRGWSRSSRPGRSRCRPAPSPASSAAPCSRVTSLRRRSAGDQHRADHEVGVDHERLDLVLRRVLRAQRAGRRAPKLAQRASSSGRPPRRRRAAHRHFHGVRAGDAAAEHRPPLRARRPARRRAARRARRCAFCRQYAPTCTDIRPATSLIGVRSGSAAVGRGDGLVGDAGRARLHQRLGLRLVGREVQIGEEHLVRCAAARIPPAAVPSP